MLRIMMAALASVGLTAGLAGASPAPGLFAVTGVAEGDVLNLRAGPSPDAEKIGEIPRAAVGIEASRCVSVARGRIVPADGAPGASRWCRVRLDAQEGWANARFLVPDRQAGPTAPVAPLYSTGPAAKAGSRQRSFLVSSTEIAPGRFRAETRHIVRHRDGPDTLEEATAIVDCARRADASDRDAANLWWAVCRGEMRRFGG
jgi:uncharacterized protein YraI